LEPLTPFPEQQQAGEGYGVGADRPLQPGSEKPGSGPIEGSATITFAASRITMKNEPRRSANAHRRRVSGADTCITSPSRLSIGMCNHELPKVLRATAGYVFPKEETVVPERIERETLIKAPIDVVWAVLTEPEHVAGWFSDSAEIDLHPGGDATFTWEDGPARAWVERVEPPRALAYRWVRSVGEEQRRDNSTLVEFTLTEEGDHTRLRVVESGFPELDWPEDKKARYADENTQGWRLELDELREYISKHVQR
jgi:uncharacterized protein YndB with AHSA1/START domain